MQHSCIWHCRRQILTAKTLQDHPIVILSFLRVCYKRVCPQLTLHLDSKGDQC